MTKSHTGERWWEIDADQLIAEAAHRLNVGGTDFYNEVFSAICFKVAKERGLWDKVLVKAAAMKLEIDDDT